MDNFDVYCYKDNFQRYAHVLSKEVLKNKVEDPFFTIMIPTYKRAETLQISVKSALEQVDAQNYEILVVNNDPEGENNEVKALLESFHSDKISYYVNAENIGLCGNWNRAIELSRGRYIIMLHDDDLLNPYFVKSMRRAIQEQNDPGFIGVDYKKFNSAELPTFSEPDTLRYRNVSKRSFFFGKYINIAGMTFKRELALALGGFADEYYPNEDTILIYQALLRDRVVNIEYPLAGYRVEMNATLSGDTMKNIILLTEKTRRSIAKHEKFARRWMRWFDDVYLYQYITNANNYWSLQIDHADILRATGFGAKKINMFKLKLMQLLLKVMNLMY